MIFPIRGTLKRRSYQTDKPLAMSAAQNGRSKTSDSRDDHEAGDDAVPSIDNLKLRHPIGRQRFPQQKRFTGELACQHKDANEVREVQQGVAYDR